MSGPKDVGEAFALSSETIERLKIYEASLRRWQNAVNLVAPKTIDDIWHRHFADSIQVARFVPPGARHLADLGSGAGFPGLVLAILQAEQGGSAVTLVESDHRKCAFLRETARAMEIPVDILSTRIESNASYEQLKSVDVVTARALAPLGRLLFLVAPFLRRSATGVFLKGRDCDAEIEEARKAWRFEATLHPSVTSADASIVIVRNIEAISGPES